MRFLLALCLAASARAATFEAPSGPRVSPVAVPVQTFLAGGPALFQSAGLAGADLQIAAGLSRFELGSPALTPVFERLAGAAQVDDRAVAAAIAAVAAERAKAADAAVAEARTGASGASLARLHALSSDPFLAPARRAEVWSRYLDATRSHAHAIAAGLGVQKNEDGTAGTYRPEATLLGRPYPLDHARSPRGPPSPRLRKLTAPALVAGLSFLPALLKAAPLAPFVVQQTVAHMARHGSLFAFAWWMIPLGAALALVDLGLGPIVQATNPHDLGTRDDHVRELARKGWPEIAAKLFVFAGVEEVTFRMIVFSGLAVIGLWAGLSQFAAFGAASLASSLWFAKMHKYGEFWPRVVSGTIYAAAFGLTGGLLLPTITHFLHNLFIFMAHRDELRGQDQR